MTPARTLVVGDIHGCADEIDCLLDALAPSASDTLIFLGDYVDRGPNSKGVIERVLRLQREGPRCVCLKGNHEDMFLAYIGERGAYGDAFLFNGGEATLSSYGLDKRGRALAAQLPEEHLRFLRSLQVRHEHGQYLCVHAGLDPSRPLQGQREEDLLWIRDAFISGPHPFPYTVLFGHTPQREVFIDLPYKIGLDTGLVYWNKLTCLELETQCVHQIRRGEREVTSRPLQPRDERGARALVG